MTKPNELTAEQWFSQARRHMVLQYEQAGNDNPYQKAASFMGHFVVTLAGLYQQGIAPADAAERMVAVVGL